MRSEELKRWDERHGVQDKPKVPAQADQEFYVKGIAFVPVQVRIKVFATGAEEAIKKANKQLKNHCRDNIVPGSEDFGAAWGFEATDAVLE
jgi:hypothetical protein